MTRQPLRGDMRIAIAEEDRLAREGGAIMSTGITVRTIAAVREMALARTEIDRNLWSDDWWVEEVLRSGEESKIDNIVLNCDDCGHRILNPHLMDGLEPLCGQDPFTMYACFGERGWYMCVRCNREIEEINRRLDEEAAEEDADSDV